MNSLHEWIAQLQGKYPPLRIRTVQHDGYDWLELALSLCPQGELKPSALLVYNFELSIAQLALSAGQALIFQTLPVDGLLRENLEEVADFLVSEAPRARAQIREAQTSEMGGGYE